MCVFQIKCLLQKDFQIVCYTLKKKVIYVQTHAISHWQKFKMAAVIPNMAE